MSVFSDAITASMASVNAVAGETVTYKRLGDSIEITATRGTRQLAVVEEGGAETTFHSTDFLCLASVINFGFGVVEPSVGDEIEATVGSNTMTFQVMDEAGGKHFEYRDHARTLLRIHTKQIETA